MSDPNVSMPSLGESRTIVYSNPTGNNTINPELGKKTDNIPVEKDDAPPPITANALPMSHLATTPPAPPPSSSRTSENIPTPIISPNPAMDEIEGATLTVLSGTITPSTEGDPIFKEE